MWCSKIVGRLIDRNFPCWAVCKRLCESEDYDDLDTKQNLIKFAILQCSDKELSVLVELRYAEYLTGKSRNEVINFFFCFKGMK